MRVLVLHPGRNHGVCLCRSLGRAASRAAPASPPPAALTLARPTFAAEELRVKGSRFLAAAAPAASVAAAMRFVRAAQLAHPGATHHCWAYRVGSGGGGGGEGAVGERASDDGEPAGTAGRPILAQLQGSLAAEGSSSGGASGGVGPSSPLNAVAVVVRYYGGTKLGAGGLARAYGGAARQALAGAAVVDGSARALVRVEVLHRDAPPLKAALLGGGGGGGGGGGASRRRRSGSGSDGDGDAAAAGGGMEPRLERVSYEAEHEVLLVSVPVHQLAPFEQLVAESAAGRAQCAQCDRGSGDAGGGRDQDGRDDGGDDDDGELQLAEWRSLWEKACDD